MEKVFIAGCGGMLGKAFYEVFNGDYNLKCTDIDVNEEWIDYLDFRDLTDYRNKVREFSPDYLFHLGAYTDLEFCEINIEDTYNTNTLSVENAALIANELNIPLLYISTAGIFDGSKDCFDDWDEPKPLGVYARTKYLGEQYVQMNVEKHLICRAGWMMGGGPTKDKKFINKIYQQIKDGKIELHIVNDKDGTPTYTYDFAKNVKLLLQNKIWGLYNMVCEGQTSRYEVALELIKILGLQNTINIVPVSSDFFKDEYFADRPISERLVNKKLNIRKMNIMRDWREALKEYIKNDFIEDFKK